ncbi:MAG: hypothetical protein V4760_16005 [Bdellovibrionota bacterium]
MTRFLVGALAFITVAASPMLAFAAGARFPTFEEEVTEKILQKFENGDMRVRMIPVAKVCGTGGEGYQVQVLVKVTRKSAGGQLVTKLEHVKTYGAIERLVLDPKIVECVN